MYEELGNVVLKTGEQVQAGVIIGPDLEWAERLEALLAHKGDPWNWQNSRVLRRDVGIGARFYVLHREGAPFANIMIAELAGAGLLAHVWTKPEERRKGASSKLMALQMADFRSRGGRALFLGTGFDSAAYRIYERFGFKGVEAQSGYMEWYATTKDEFEAVYFLEGETEIQPLAWTHWPASQALFLGDFSGLVRCAPAKLVGRQMTEGPLLPLLRDAERRRESGEAPRALALWNVETRAVTGFAAWAWHPLWAGTCLVDVYCHPGYWERAVDLWASLALPDAKRYVAYVDAGFSHKRSVLLEQGFLQTAVLRDRLVTSGTTASFCDVAVFEKVPLG